MAFHSVCTAYADQVKATSISVSHIFSLFLEHRTWFELRHTSCFGTYSFPLETREQNRCILGTRSHLHLGSFSNIILRIRLLSTNSREVRASCLMNKTVHFCVAHDFSWLFSKQKPNQEQNMRLEV